MKQKIAIIVLAVILVILIIVHMNKDSNDNCEDTTTGSINTSTIDTTTPIEETTDTTEIPVETTAPVEETTSTPETTYVPGDDLVLPVPDYVHIIQSGDTFWDLSRKYYGNSQYTTAIARYNGLELNSVVHLGFEFKIPDLSNPYFQKIYEDIKNETPDVTYMSGETIKAGQNGIYKYGERGNPAIDITVPTGTDMRNNTLEVDTSNYIWVGKWMVTGYTPTCEHCCHSTEGIAASGVRAICGYTIATPINLHIPFQTTIYIPGYGYYVNEDRVDTGNRVMDIAAPTHESCGPLTQYDINCYIVPNPGDEIIVEYGYKKLVDSTGRVKLIVDPYGNVCN